jgi:serine/threonine protein kinase
MMNKKFLLSQMILGKGTYGEVSIRDGKAVKKFGKLSHLIQEYMALRYLDDCVYVVHSKDVNFSKLELHMELYDCSLRDWLRNKRENGGVTQDDIMKILRDVLFGLVELHDRELAHGDLKPGNILVKLNPLTAVLGDCGFVSIAKYAKVDRTADIYRDPIVNHDSLHDMFSFGICFLEMIAEIRINRQATYDELEEIINDKVDDPEHMRIIYNLLHKDRNRRPTSRNLLHKLFEEDPQKWIANNMIFIEPYGQRSNIPDFSQILSRQDMWVNFNKNKLVSTETQHISKKSVMNMLVISTAVDKGNYIRGLMKAISYEYGINRANKGYCALLLYIDNHKVEQSHHCIYTAVTLMILSSIFGKSGFRENNVIEMCSGKYSLFDVYKILGGMLSDRIFINILLSHRILFLK